MIVNGRHKLKFWAEGLVFLFSKWKVLETNLPCKQNEITGIVATPTPKKNGGKTPVNLKHKRDRNNDGKGKKNKTENVEYHPHKVVEFAFFYCFIRRHVSHSTDGWPAIEPNAPNGNDNCRA